MKILAFSGRAQAGKNSSANWMTGLVMQHFEHISHHFINENGDLVIPIDFDGKIVDTVINLSRPTQWIIDEVFPHIKQYSFADPLKEICMNLFDLTWEQCYGTNEQKNSPTSILWDKIPDNIRKKFKKTKTDIISGRELMQAFGTEVVRKINPHAWANACLNRILIEQPEIAVITDCRFACEVAKVKECGGRVIRFTRNPLNSDHESESELDEGKYNWGNFDAIVDNKDLSIDEQNAAVFEVIKEWDILDCLV